MQKKSLGVDAKLGEKCFGTCSLFRGVHRLTQELENILDWLQLN